MIVFATIKSPPYKSLPALKEQGGEACLPGILMTGLPLAWDITNNEAFLHAQPSGLVVCYYLV
jgi:hypothetical protein